MAPTLQKAIGFVEKHGILLVFPIQNHAAPPSLWSCLYPKSKMKWEWDDDADNRVVKMWHLREELSRSRDVVYTKWYKGRATFLSLKMAAAIYAAAGEMARSMSPNARTVLGMLEEDSPISSKKLKKRLFDGAGLVGKEVDRALKDLWPTLRIVGFGEIDDGAFPSLALGATSVIFEDVVGKARSIGPKASQKIFKEVSDLGFSRQLAQMGNIRPPPEKSIVRYSDLHPSGASRKSS